MALLLNVTSTPVGVGFKDAYARVATVMVSRQVGGGHRVMVDVAIYATTPDDNTQNVDLRRYWADVEEVEGDILPSVYSWLKAHEDFKGAVDA